MIGDPSPFGAQPRVYRSRRDGVEIAVFQLAPGRGARGQGAPGPWPAGRPPLLLVHGATADHTTWRTVGPAFAETRPVYAVDRRGRGASGDAEAYRIEREFEDLATVAEALAAEAGVAAIDVAGHSYGGRCALGASLLTPAIRRAVVYEGAPVPPGMSYRPPSLVEAVRAAMDRGDREAALTTFLAGIVGMSDAELDAYRANPVWPARVEAAQTILREVEAESSPEASIEALGRVSVPVLLLLGSSSRSPFRIGTDALAARLAHAEIRVIEGAAHAAHHTHAREFVAAIEGFLDRA